MAPPHLDSNTVIVVIVAGQVSLRQLATSEQVSNPKTTGRDLDDKPRFGTLETESIDGVNTPLALATLMRRKQTGITTIITKTTEMERIYWSLEIHGLWRTPGVESFYATYSTITAVNISFITFLHLASKMLHIYFLFSSYADYVTTTSHTT